MTETHFKKFQLEGACVMMIDHINCA